MNRYLTLLSLLSSLLLFAGSISFFTFADELDNVKNPSVITIDEARNIALRAYPGVVTYEEAKKTRKGQVFKYSFDIDSNGVQQNVMIDAITGKIVRYRVKTYQGE